MFTGDSFGPSWNEQVPSLPPVRRVGAWLSSWPPSFPCGRGLHVGARGQLSPSVLGGLTREGGCRHRLRTSPGPAPAVCFHQAVSDVASLLPPGQSVLLTPTPLVITCPSVAVCVEGGGWGSSVVGNQRSLGSWEWEHVPNRSIPSSSLGCITYLVFFFFFFFNFLSR